MPLHAVKFCHILQQTGFWVSEASVDFLKQLSFPQKIFHSTSQVSHSCVRSFYCNSWMGSWCKLSHKIRATWAFITLETLFPEEKQYWCSVNDIPKIYHRLKKLPIPSKSHKITTVVKWKLLRINLKLLELFIPHLQFYKNSNICWMDFMLKMSIYKSG